MKLKKVCVSLLAVLMLISSLQITAFAEDGQVTNPPNVDATVFLGNEDCVNQEALKDVSASIKITKDENPEVSAEFPITYDAVWQWFEAVTYVEDEDMATILADLTANQAEYGDIIDLGDLELGEDETLSAKTLKSKMAKVMEENVAENIDIFKGYTVTVEGLPEGEHFTYKNDGLMMTGKLVVDSFTLSVKIIEEVGKEMGMELPFVPTTYTELLEATAQMMGYQSYEEMCKDLEYTDAEYQEEMALMQQQDEILAQAKAGTYPGQLILMGELTCECPDLEYYEIYHEYYKEINGKRTLVARIGEGEMNEYGEYYLSGEAGAYIRAEDWKKCEFDGVTYDFVNSYDSWVIYEETPNWEENIVAEFKLGDFEHDGLCLRYVHVEEAAEGSTDSDAPTDNDQTGEEAPLTGDHTPIGLYIALFVTAIAAAIALVVYNKKKSR